MAHVSRAVWGVCPLDLGGENLARWEKELKAFARSQGAESILLGIDIEPTVQWRAKNAAIITAILGTIPQVLMGMVAAHRFCHEIFTAVHKCFRDGMLVKQRRFWRTWDILDSDAFPSVGSFTLAFKGMLNVAREIGVILREAEIIHRFLGAMQSTMPGFSHQRMEEVRRNSRLNLDQLIHEVHEAAWAHGDAVEAALSANISS